MNILKGYIFTYLYLFLVLAIMSLLKNRFDFPEETTRKLIHIFVGFSWFIMVYFFKTTFHLIIPPLTFIFINYFSYKKDLIKSMERKENNSLGTIYYALSFTLLAFITYLKPSFLPFYGIGVLTMALGDGLAPFVGNYLNFPISHSKKTYSGSFCIFIIAILISIIFNKYFILNFNFLKYIIIGLSATIFELLGSKYDNLTLPLGVAIISFIL